MKTIHTTASLALIATAAALGGVGCGGSPAQTIGQASYGSAPAAGGESAGGYYATGTRTSAPAQPAPRSAPASTSTTVTVSGGVALSSDATSPPAPAPRHASAGTSAGAGAGAVVTAEATANRGPTEAPVEAPPSVRPGLATEWGEARTSQMTYTPFVRASAQPFDMASIYYNDAQGAAVQASYHAATSAPNWIGAYNNGVRLSLRDENSNPLPGYFVNDRLYVLGHAGQRYSILVENSTPARFEAVVSVDGLDVINGQPATPGNRGYILMPHGRVEIEGFRQNQDTVASFRFGAVADSYAAQTGSARNVGVIGLALFAERGVVLQPIDGNEVQLRETANPFPGQFATPPARRNY